MTTRAIFWGCIALGAPFLACSAYSQELNGIAHRFLQRHGIPCLSVLKVDFRDALGEAATCEDGREWALFWLEDEIAIVQAQTGELYKWDREIYRSYPQIYSGRAPPPPGRPPADHVTSGHSSSILLTR